MSIDLDCSVTREFSVASLVEVTIENVRKLVGIDVSRDLLAALRPYDEPDSPVVTDRLGSWLIGRGRPPASIELALAPNVLVWIESSALDDDWDEASIQSTAAFRTASSVLVAIASILAANTLGEGVFEASVERLFERTVEDPDELLALLRVEPGLHIDLEAASRDVLRKTIAFGTWKAVTDGIPGYGPGQVPTPTEQ